MEISRPSEVDAYQWLREVCNTNLLQAPIKLGGPECVVQIDESLFRHKPKVCTIDVLYSDFSRFLLSASQRSGNCTRAMGVGLVDVSQRPALGYMELVSRRRSNTATNYPGTRYSGNNHSPR